MEEFCRLLGSICTFLPKITFHTRVDLVHIRLITDKINTEQTFFSQSNKFDFEVRIIIIKGVDTW